MRVLVTGAAGFIGSALSKRLLDQGDEVVGIDNLNDYYDVSLKEARIARLVDYENFEFHRLDIEDVEGVRALFASAGIQRVMHLAAQAGVRYSIESPSSYIDANMHGFLNILEGCRHYPVEHLVYASTSSVYGANRKMPFSVEDEVNHPVSLYAATKKANELMAHTYSHLFSIPTTGLRFFTVYGPWGRPDMALFKFTKNILEGKPIDVYGYGEQSRDFTYIDDIVEGIKRVLDQPAQADSEWDAENPNPATAAVPYRLHNIGSNNPQPLMRYIEVLEQCLGKEARKNMLPMQPGDVRDTFADVSSLINAVNYQPSTAIEDGVQQFVRWYVKFYKYKN
ncbi:NAD-dependent epimerase [bacterium]|nr:NAD-dependent epimerase [bacterium]